MTKMTSAWLWNRSFCFILLFHFKLHERKLNFDQEQRKLRPHHLHSFQFFNTISMIIIIIMINVTHQQHNKSLYQYQSLEHHLINNNIRHIRNNFWSLFFHFFLEKVCFVSSVCDRHQHFLWSTFLVSEHLVSLG